jgi:hypothetical protein
MLHIFGIILGVLGSVICIIGTKTREDHDKSILFLAGSVFLMVMAIINGRPFFIGMEVLITAGCLLQLTTVSTRNKSIFWAVASVSMVIALTSIGEVRSSLDVAGMIGLLVLALGYATLKADLYMSASIILAGYSFAQFYFVGGSDNIIFGILNIWFAQSAYQDTQDKLKEDLAHARGLASDTE